jgi:hypothetical protein
VILVKNLNRPLCALYLGIAVVALISCWSQNLQYAGESLWDGNLHFWQDTWVTPASRSITLDILLFYLSAATWMLLEARKLKIKFVWAYLIFGLIIAISVTFPLFLIAREIKLSSKPKTLAG